MKSVIMKPLGEVPEQAFGFSTAYDNGAFYLTPTEDQTNRSLEAVHLTTGAEIRYKLPKFKSPPQALQPLPNGKLLTFTVREGITIFNENGEIVSTFDVGQCVADIQVDELSRIWVSYFDEKDIGAPALVCFNNLGKVLAEFGPNLVDAYAINVSADTTHLYAYIEFDLWEIDAEFNIRVFHNPIRGADSVATYRDLVLFSAQYNEEPGTIHILRKEGKSLVDHKIGSLKRPDHVKMSDPHIWSRGEHLYCFDGKHCFSVSVSDCSVFFDM